MEKAINIVNPHTTDDKSFNVAKTKKTKKINRGKEVKIDTHLKEKKKEAAKKKRVLKTKETIAKKKELEKVQKQNASKKQVVKEANRNEELAIKLSPKERKVNNSESKDRLERAKKTPFSYYYNVSRDVSNNIVYCNINQCLNDKFVGRIYQPQYFAIAEQSGRIFTINELLIRHALGVCLLNPEYNFVVQISPKYFEKKENCKVLDELLVNAPSNLIICLDARALTISGDIGRRNLIDLVEKYKIKVMLDNPETERMSILFDYPIQYVRLDGRYYRDRNLNKVAFVKVINEYCKNQKINLCAKYIDSKEEKSWMLANGVRYVEGNIVQKAKNSVTASLKK